MKSKKLFFFVAIQFLWLSVFSQSFTVDWTELNGATLTQNGIGVPANEFEPWLKGAVSANKLTPTQDGQIEHTLASGQLCSFAFGLTHTPEIVGDLNQLTHAFVIEGGELMVYENGALYSMLGPVNGGEVLVIKRQGLDAHYYVDDLEVALSVSQTEFDFWGAISFNEPDCYVDSFLCSFPAPLSVSYTATQVSCQSLNSGAVFLEITGGNPPYAVIWDNGANTQSISSLNEGTYIATIADANNNSVQITTEVNHEMYWDELLNVSVTNNSIVAQGDGVAVSGNVLFPDQEGWVEFIFQPQALYNSVWGLAKSENQTIDLSDIDYGFSVLDEDILAIYEVGNLIGIYGGLEEGDLLRIQRTEIDPQTTNIQYLLNGEILREVSTLPDLLLANKVALYGNASMPIPYGSFGCAGLTLDFAGADSLSVYISGAGFDETFNNQSKIELELNSPIQGASEDIRADITFPNLSGTLSFFLTIDGSGKILVVDHLYADIQGTLIDRNTTDPGSYLLRNGRCVEIKPAKFRDIILQLGCIDFFTFGGLPNSTNQNWVYYKSYGDLVKEGDNLSISESVTFSNGLGKPLQSQYADHAKRLILANQPVYDKFGIPTLNTLTAPIEGLCKFQYKTNFILSSPGNPYAWQDFDLKDGTTNTLDAPTPVDPSSYLGKYFSNQNSLEPYIGTTDYPFTRFAVSHGGVARAGGSADPIRIGTAHETRAFSAPVFDELDHYTQFLGDFTPDLSTSITTLSLRAIKLVSIDQNGDETIEFYGPRGNVIATCISGPECPTSHKKLLTISTAADYGYIDFHIPKGADGILTFTNSQGDQVEIRDLTSGEIIFTGTTTNVPTLATGYYRIYDRTDISTPMTFFYEATYYGFNYFYYDKAGRQIAETNPEGVRNVIENNIQTLSNIVSTADYTSWSAYKSNSVDDGELVSVRTTDGRLRFSQDALQAQNNDFSYVNYDLEGRVIETGVCTTGTYIIQNELAYAQNPNPNAANKTSVVDNISNWPNSFVGSEASYTLYDIAAGDLPSVIANCSWLAPHIAEYKQKFVRGGISRTSNSKSTTWYSYDEFGRLKWTIQAIANEPEFPNGFELFTTEYSYNFQGNVLEVVHDRFKNNEQIWRRNVFDKANNLARVDFKADKSASWERQAGYEYYADGGVKREEIGKDLQGIDYIYTTEGQLKAINHPDLIEEADAGKDSYSGIHKSFAPDVFGQVLDYYLGDYERDNTHFSQQTVQSMSNADEQFNGLMAANRSAIKGYNVETINGHPTTYQATYYYNYDHFYQLKKAEYHRALPVYVPVSGGGLSSHINSTVHNGDYDVSNVTYDYNGNIKTLERNAYEDVVAGISRPMDNLSYHYDDPSHPNRLSYVGETVINQGLGDFKFGQPSTPANYQYNVLGFLVEDKANDLSFTYNLYDQLSQITKTSTGELYTSYEYDEAGQLLYKIDHKYQTNADRVTLYIRDPFGNISSIYESLRTISQEGQGPLPPPVFQQIEAPIYAMGRIGNYYRLTNTSLYEIKDDQGNVRVVIEEDKDPISGEASMVSYASYYPFGWSMPGKSGNLNSNYNYRYGYQGQAYDPRTEWYDFALRAYDPRLARWFNPDPYLEFYSPYLAMGNQPGVIDPTGGETGTNDPIYDAGWRDGGIIGGIRDRAGIYDEGSGAWSWLKRQYNKVKNASVSDWVEGAIEIAGYIPGVSNAVAVLETGYYLVKGDYVAAGAAGAAIILGPAGKVAGKAVLVVVKNLDKVGDAGKAITKVIKRGPKTPECTCFPEGTPILTINGYIPIEEIATGDTVWSYDEQLQQPVLQRVHHPIMGDWHYVADITLADGSTISATYDHPFYTWNGQWKAAGQLEAGDTLFSYIYDEAVGATAKMRVVASVEVRDTVVTVYNFGVEGTRTYYAGERGVLVHNCGTNFTSKSGKFTEPTLPGKTVVNEKGVRIEHYYKSGDHAPPHMHVYGNGPNTKIGKNGKAVKGSPEPSADQQKVIDENLPAIRKTGKKIGKHQKFHDHLINQ